MVDAVLEDPRSAPITEKEKTLFAFIERVNGASYELRRDEVASLGAAGWSEEAIYDAISVCALFNFYNRWCDGTGVHPMAPDHHAMGGKRMAQFGYLPPES
jgi:alkylhydroperoxidase family enzyme